METQNRPYPSPGETTQENPMPGRKYQIPQTKELFRVRLVQFRKAAGLSQKEFALAVGLSPRMAAYYETESTHPPTHLLAVFSKVLGVSTDQLLGVEKVKVLKKRDSRLRRLMEEVEHLPASRRKQVAINLEAFLKAWKNEKTSV